MQIYSDKCFENPIKILEARENLESALREIDELRKRYFLLGYITYDFKYLYFEAFDKYEKYTPKEPKQLGTIIKPLVSKETYINAINKIKEYISEGVTYEVNYTYPSEVLTNLDGLNLYESLLTKQKTPYNTYIENAQTTLMSFSPELFFKLDGRKIVTKPMKGTAPVLNDGSDDKRRDFLYHDTKNRAENIMIVDLLRNDLGRISKTGTVKVDKLFEIEKHPTVFQMTSEISAELEDNIGLYEIFKAIFPCGSITGAPKVSTMRVIEELEPFSRNIYCGAIGFLSPETVEFSVPIRILYGKNHKYTYHAGGAIVWDSTAEDEWEETLTKTKFLQTDFQLIETGIDDWESHLARMEKSAIELGFEFHKPFIEGAKRVLLSKDGSFEIQTYPLPSPLVGGATHVDNFQDYRIPPSPLVGEGARRAGEGYIKLTRKVNSANPFLYHKTTIRETLTPPPNPLPQGAREEAFCFEEHLADKNNPVDLPLCSDQLSTYVVPQGTGEKSYIFFDEIGVNERGEITEGTFTNVAAQIVGKLYTPPVECGLLAGTYRAKLLREGVLEEKILYPEDLIKAEKIFCFNSVRKMVEVKLCL